MADNEGMGDLLFRFLRAPQQDTGAADPTGLFQYRANGNPGQIRDLSSLGAAGVEGGSPSEAIRSILNYGPRTDISTARGVHSVGQQWTAREKQRPGEGMIYVDPRFNDPDVYRHEAAHSLYDQIVGPESPKAGQVDLNGLADQLKLPYTAMAPQLRGTEALGSIAGDQSKGPASQQFIQELGKYARTPQPKAAFQQLLKLLVDKEDFQNDRWGT